MKRAFPAAPATLIAWAGAVAYRSLLRRHRIALRAADKVESLEHAEELFRGAFEDAPYGMALVDLEGRYLRVNSALCTLTGYTSAALLKLTVQQITHPDELERHLSAMRRSIAGDLRPDSVDRRYLCADGSYVWAERHLTLLHDADGAPLYFIVQVHDITERKRAEETRARLAQLVDSSEDAIMGVTLDGVIESWNRGAQGLYGYSAEEALGQPIGILVPPERRDELARILAQRARGELVEPLDTVRTAKDGRSIDVSLRISLVRDAAGELVGTSSIARDISGQKRLEAELRSSGRYFELSRDLVCTAGFDGYFRQLNAAWSELLGWSDEELHSRPFVEFVHPEDREKTRSSAANLAAGGSTVSLVNRYATKDGGWRWLDWSSNIAPDEGLIYATARDITDRVAMEAALEASERRTRMILETAHDAFVAMDEDDVITDWNPQAEATFGWPREQAVGRRLAATILPERRRDEHDRRLKEFMASRQYTSEGTLVELTALHRDGHEFPVELTITPLEHGGRWSFNAFLRDITERKRSEQELTLAHAKAVEASRLKSEFVANMSHEIRTPLNGVIGMSGLLLTTELNDEQREYADAVSASADALMTVIDDILDFSKIEVGKLEIENQPFSLRGVVEGVTSVVAAPAQAKGLELMSWVDEALPAAVSGDGNRVRQVLSNLMTNAVKFTAAGEVSVHVTGAPAATGKVELRFEVADTGIGIEADALERVFESFAQADGSTTRRYGGTGLGLAISKRLVGLMGGELGVRSAPGQGSTFWFTVPVEVAQIDTASREDAELWGMRVLVVDDNATNRRILERQLTSWGMTCETAGDAETALRMLSGAAQSGCPHSLAVLDAVMPGTDGIELAMAIKAQPALRSVRLLMVTSAVNAREAAMRAGVDGVVNKPVRRSRLHDEVLRALASNGPAYVPDVVPARAAPRELSPPTPGRRVLVAEDNPVNQIVAVRMLERRGFAVDVAANGREALEMHVRCGYDAIFMDCQMPELDGYEATAEIRHLEGADRYTPIIAMTANTMKGDEERCLAAGMDDYVAKPVRPQALDEVIARALAVDGARPPGDRSRSASPLRPDEAGADVQAPLVDGSLLEDVCRGDEQARENLVAMFMDQSRTSVEALAQAMAAGDAGTLERVAHGLKGSSAVVGALRVSEISGRLCEAARAGRLTETHGLHVDLERSLALTNAVFEHPLQTEET